MRAALIVLVGLAALLFSGGAAAAVADPALGRKLSARGIRNNNPFNLRPLPHGQTWRGQSGVDPGNYVTFESAAAGLRAGFKNLRNQQLLHGLRTVRAIITKYAPASDNNDTEAYIADVAGALGVDPDRGELDLVHNLAQLAALGAAVIHHENGVQFYADSDLRRAAVEAVA